MAPFIQSVLDQVKGDVAEALSPQKIEQICHELNYVWRACTLDPVTTVRDKAAQPRGKAWQGTRPVTMYPIWLVSTSPARPTARPVRGSLSNSSSG